MIPLRAFHHPGTVAEALRILVAAEGRAAPLAGGTALIFSRPVGVEELVDLAGVGLGGIVVLGDLLQVGATVRARDLAGCTLADALGLRLLREAAATCGSRLLQNAITVGGNLIACHPWSDLPPALLVLDGEARLRSEAGERGLPFDELFAQPPARSLQPAELLTGVSVRRLPPRSGAAFLKLGRTAVDYALCNLAARIDLDDDGRCASARIAVGALRPLPQRVPEAEAALAGRPLDATALAEAATRVRDGVEVSADMRASRDYRRELAGVLARRALARAWSRARGLAEDEATDTETSP